MDDPKLTVFFDGSCPLCRKEISYYQRQRGADAIFWKDVSALSDDPAAGLSCSAAMARFHVQTNNGELVSGAAGFAALWRALPKFRWAGVIAGFAPITWALELAYRAFLPIRPWLQRRAS